MKSRKSSGDDSMTTSTRSKARRDAGFDEVRFQVIVAPFEG